LLIVRASDSDTSFFICIVFLWFFRPSLAKIGNEGCNEIVTTFDFVSLPPEGLLPADDRFRFRQFISLCICILRLLHLRREIIVLYLGQNDRTFVRANCATLGAIGNDNDAFIVQVCRMKCGLCSISKQNENEVRSANAARRDQRTFRCGVTRARRGRKKEKRSRVSFRQRHGGGRCAPASFQPSLRSASLFRSPNRRPKRADG
jgi:hypothetical protein